MTEASEIWVPEACTLPTVEQPLRRDEWNSLFATALTAQERPSPTALRWTLDPTVEPSARDLAEREVGCCSFFTFDFTVAGPTLQVEVRVPLTQVKVLDALAARASASMTRS